MLPFLKPQKTVSVIMAKRTPEQTTEVVGEKGDESPGLMAAAEDILHAIEAKDAKRLAAALRAASDCMDEAQETAE